MIDLGKLSYFLGIKFKETNRGYFMHQKKYVIDMLKRFNMEDCNTTKTPINTSTKLVKESKVDLTLYKQIIGSL